MGEVCSYQEEDYYDEDDMICDLDNPEDDLKNFWGVQHVRSLQRLRIVRYGTNKWVKDIVRVDLYQISIIILQPLYQLQKIIQGTPFPP